MRLMQGFPGRRPGFHLPFRLPGRMRRILPPALVLASLCALPLSILALWPYPELDTFLSRGYSTRILDRQGGLLAILPAKDGTDREWLPHEEIPPELRTVFTGAEDARFYLHPGIDPLSLGRSFFAWLSGSPSGGASTITMQLARMIRTDSGRLDPPVKKLLQILDALRLELRFSKERILELYLSNLPFGSGAEGIVSASRRLLASPVRELSSSELCLLAVVPRRPDLYTPAKDPAMAARAASALARRLISSGKVSSSLVGDSSEAAFFTLAVNIARRPDALRKPKNHSDSIAPHFIRDCFVTGLAGLELPPPSLPGRTGPGFGATTIRTSLDPVLQRTLVAALREGVADGTRDRVDSGSGLVVDNRTGEVLAWAGSPDFSNIPARGQIDGVLVTGQPGSALKPFLYAAAIEKGMTPATLLSDSPVDFGGEEAYVPLNFNNHFSGSVRLRVALASSLNVPAVRTLESLGLSRFAHVLEELGIESAAAMVPEAGLGSALGAAPASLLELVRAYTVFPRGGNIVALTPYFASDPGMIHPRSSSRSLSPRGTASSGRGKRVFSPYAAGIIRDILSDQASRFTGFAGGRLFERNYSAMFKTGTANQFQELWAFGATPTLTAGIWMGSFTGNTATGRATASLPAKVLVQVLDRGADRQDRFDPVPESRKLRICSVSGGLATPSCPDTLEEWFRLGSRSPEACTVHAHLDEGPASSRTGTAKPGQFMETGGTPGAVRENSSPSLRFARPRPGAIYYYDDSIPASEQAVGVVLEGFISPAARIEIESPEASGIPASVRPDQQGKITLPLVRGSYTLRVRDKEGIRCETSFRVE